VGAECNWFLDGSYQLVEREREFLPASFTAAPSGLKLIFYLDFIDVIDFFIIFDYSSYSKY
jgi:hypothetical protein